MPEISKRRRLKGVVSSAKMERTVVVTVTTERKHPKYHKHFERSQRLKAHVDSNEYKEGDKVVIEETRPLSKEKRWRVIGLVSKAEEPS